MPAVGVAECFGKINHSMIRIASVWVVSSVLLLTFLASAQTKPGPSIPKVSAQPPWVRQTSPTKAQGVIVFVHGVMGDDRSTWMNGTTYWPELLTHDRIFDDQDIYVYHYPSPKAGNSLSIGEVADNLRITLNVRGVLRYKQITFICHSMGGLITRAFLVKYREDLAAKIRLLYFFSTPTTGSQYADIATILSKNPQFIQMRSMAEPASYLADLQSNWLAAANLSRIPSYCAYEKQPLYGQLIVGIDSATQLCNRSAIAIDANHISIVKPRDAESTSYIAFKSAFEDTASLTDTLPPPTNRPTASGNRTAPIPVPSLSPLEGLTNLGWTVVASANNPTVVNFQNARSPLPDMNKSAQYMKAMGARLNVGIIEASSLLGLSQLAPLQNIVSLQLSGQFPDLSELRSFRYLQSLNLVGASTRDLAPLAGLVQLHELILQQPHENAPDLAPLSALVNLRRLVISGFAFHDLRNLHTLTSLEYLDLTETPVTDFSALRDLPDLKEIIIDQRSAPALLTLGNRIRILRVRHHDGLREPIDLGPIPALQNLRTLEVTAAGTLTLTPLRSVHNLTELIITGTELSFRDFGNFTVHLVDPDAIGTLQGLKKLGLAWVDIRDMTLTNGLTALEEIYVNQTRSLSDVRALGNLGSLRAVQLVATSVVDISPLLNLKNLKKLTIQVTPARLDVITELKSKGVVIEQ